jgi:hypothetical protein
MCQRYELLAEVIVGDVPSSRSAAWATSSFDTASTRAQISRCSVQPLPPPHERATSPRPVRASTDAADIASRTRPATRTAKPPEDRPISTSRSGEPRSRSSLLQAEVPETVRPLSLGSTRDASIESCEEFRVTDVKEPDDGADVSSEAIVHTSDDATLTAAQPKPVADVPAKGLTKKAPAKKVGARKATTKKAPAKKTAPAKKKAPAKKVAAAPKYPDTQLKRRCESRGRCMSKMLVSQRLAKKRSSSLAARLSTDHGE